MPRSRIDIEGRVSREIISGLKEVAGSLRGIGDTSTDVAQKLDKVQSRLLGVTRAVGRLRNVLSEQMQTMQKGISYIGEAVSNMTAYLKTSVGFQQLLLLAMLSLRTGHNVAAAAAHRHRVSIGSLTHAMAALYEILSRVTYPFRQMARGIAQASGLATLLGFGGFVAGGLVLGALARNVISTGIAFERFEQQIRTFTGSAKMAAAEMNKISEFAKQTPFELEDVTAAFVSLAQVGIAPTSERLRIIGDYAAATANNITRVADAVRAAVGGGQFDRLIELGIPKAAIQQLAPEGFVGEKVADRAKVLSAILQYMTSRTAGTMARSGQTLRIQWSNLLDSMTRSSKALYDSLSSGLKQLIIAFRESTELLTRLMQRSQRFRALMTTMADPQFHKRIVAGVKDITTWLIVISQIFSDHVIPLAKSLASYIWRASSNMMKVVMNSLFFRMVLKTAHQVLERIATLAEQGLAEAIKPRYWWQWALTIYFGAKGMMLLYRISVATRAVLAQMMAIMSVTTWRAIFQYAQGAKVELTGVALAIGNIIAKIMTASGVLNVRIALLFLELRSYAGVVERIPLSLANYVRVLLLAMRKFILVTIPAAFTALVGIIKQAHAAVKLLTWQQIKATMIAIKNMAVSAVTAAIANFSAFITGLSVAITLAALLYFYWDKIKETIKAASDWMARIFGLDELKDIKDLLNINFDEIRDLMRGENITDVLKDINENVKDMLPPSLETAENTRGLREDFVQFFGQTGPAIDRPFGPVEYAAASRIGPVPYGVINIHIPPISGGPIESYINNAIAMGITEALNQLFRHSRGYW